MRASSFSRRARLLLLITAGVGASLALASTAGCSADDRLTHTPYPQVRAESIRVASIDSTLPVSVQHEPDISEIALPGVKLAVVPDLRLYEQPPVLQVIHRGHKQLISNLNQLQGLVRISSPEAALLYVRAWAGVGEDGILVPGAAEMEVTDVKTFLHRPKTWYGFKPQLPMVRENGRSVYYSGVNGVLSERAFQRGGFFPPQVKRVPGGFTITRWTFSNINSQRVQEIQEFVGESGSYRRVILKRMKPPPLPATEWEYPFRI